MQIEILTNQIANLSQAIRHINAGRTERAVELIERALDSCILGLGNIKKKGDIPDQRSRDLLIEGLKAARIYRQRHPRRVAPGSGTAAEFQKIVQRILEEVGDDD